MKNYSKYIDNYIQAIISNEIEHCKEQEEMINNIVIPTLEREDVYIDEARITRGLSLQKYFPYRLLEWEVFLFALIAGVFLKNGDNFFKVIRIYVGRGSGKNGFIDFLIFYFISPAHGVKGYNIDLLANSEKQALVSFNDVWGIINEPSERRYANALKNNFYTTKEIIIGKRTKSEVRFNTSSKRGKDSKRTGCVIYDEKHEYLTAENINTLKSGLGKVPQGREITISTDGHIRGAIFDKEKEQSRDILKEYNRDNRTLVFWCRIEAEEEAKNENKWVKAIPSINDFKDLKETLRQELKDMPYNLDYYPEFMAKRMNFPVGNTELEVASWDNILATNQEIPEVSGLNCVGALDYAKTNDFVAVGLLFKVEDKYIWKQHTFVCAASRDLKGIKAPISEWAKKGDLEIVNDVEIPPGLIIDWFDEMGRIYRIEEIALDSFRYSLMNTELRRIGFHYKDYKNIWLTRPSDVMKAYPLINSAFINHNMVWGDCPLMRWYANNTKLSPAPNGNYKFDKIEPALRKNDGFMALAAAMSRADKLETATGADVLLPVMTFG